MICLMGLIDSDQTKCCYNFGELRRFGDVGPIGSVGPIGHRSSRSVGGLESLEGREFNNVDMDSKHVTAKSDEASVNNNNQSTANHNSSSVTISF